MMRLTNFLRSIDRNLPVPRRIRRLYNEMDYLDAYSAHTDLKVDRDPFGPKWDEMGKHQFKFLVAQGLRPHHKLFDIGCGRLRGGRFFIEYLDIANYTGTDISPKAIDACKWHVSQQQGLSEKTPTLVVNGEKRLLFNQFIGSKFDFILAQSVFSHLKDEFVADCFSNIRKIMHTHSMFYFTFREDSKKGQLGVKSFCFPVSFFVDLCEQHGFRWELLSKEYKHPGGQSMMCARPTE